MGERPVRYSYSPPPPLYSPGRDFNDSDSEIATEGDESVGEEESFGDEREGDEDEENFGDERVGDGSVGDERVEDTGTSEEEREGEERDGGEVEPAAIEAEVEEEGDGGEVGLGAIEAELEEEGELREDQEPPAPPLLGPQERRVRGVAGESPRLRQPLLPGWGCNLTLRDCSEAR